MLRLTHSYWPVTEFTSLLGGGDDDDIAVLLC